MSAMQKSNGLAAFVLLICAGGAQARVTRVVVEKRESPAFGGQTFVLDATSAADISYISGGYQFDIISNSRGHTQHERRREGDEPR